MSRYLSLYFLPFVKTVEFFLERSLINLQECQNPDGDLGAFRLWLKIGRRKRRARKIALSQLAKICRSLNAGILSIPIRHSHQCKCLLYVGFAAAQPSRFALLRLALSRP